MTAGSSRSRDVGRVAVGEAEARAFGGSDAERDRPLAELVERARRITDGEWWREGSGPAVTVTAARTGARSSVARATLRPGRVDVSLADGQHDLATLAHELAHALAGVEHGHDEAFVAAHLDLTALLVGAAGATALAEAFAHFDLRPGRRRWPPPWRAEGDGFRVVTAPAMW